MGVKLGRALFALVFVLATIWVGQSPGSADEQPADPPHEEDRAIPGVWTVGYLASLPPEVAEVGASFGAGSVTRVFGELNAIEVHTDEQLDVTLAGDPLIRYVEHVYPVDVVAEGYTPNDPLFPSPSQYGPQQIGAPAAWTLGDNRGDEDAAVCVIDTGATATHEDLDPARRDAWIDYTNGPSATPIDTDGHGTHVTGIAAATVNNALGIAGLGNVRIYSARAVGNGGDGNDLVEAIQWCSSRSTAHTVINMSLSIPGANQLVQDAINAAVGAGRIVVAAAGNDTSPCGSGALASPAVCYPARYNNVIAVSCTDINEAICNFSRRGPQIDVTAPGNQVLSLGRATPSSYMLNSGTSMSAPHVSGALALAWSINEGETGSSMTARLLDTARGIGAPGFDENFGNGVVDAKCLLSRTPYFPRNVVATGGVREIRVGWDAPKYACDHPVTSYRIRRADSGGGPFSIIATINNGSARTYTDTSLSNGQQRWYRVTAINDVGPGMESDADSGTTYSLPGAPTNVVARPGTSVGSIVVSWQPPSSNGGSQVFNYLVYRTSTPGGAGSVVQYINALSWTDTGRTAGTTYYYKIVARTAVGDGPASAQVCSKPFPSPLGVC